MQEEINQKNFSLAIQVSKLSSRTVAKAFSILLQTMKNKAQNPKIYRGKQSVKHLVRQGTSVTHMDMAEKGLADFEKIARKYGIDFAVRKDTISSPPKYLLFFKSRDADVMTAAFREFTAKQAKKQIKPSLLQKLAQNIAKLRVPKKEIDKHKQREEVR